jgi:Transposase zinc-binding domain
MACGPKEAGGVYHPRQPQQAPFYQLVERFYPQFEAVYSERYQDGYGYWRPIIGTVVRKFLECGDLQLGFARVRCPQCREEFFVADSCRERCFCPSSHEKRALEKASWVAEHVCAEVPHRQFVFTIPKLLRIYFRFERRLLGELAARTVIAVFGAPSGRPDAVPGMVGAIQTFGQLAHWHPHIQHSGFSVDQSVRLEAGDAQGIQRLIQYFLRCSFSQARMIEVTEAGQVIYKTEHNAVGRFPEPGDEELVAGPSRNFQVFDPWDFLGRSHPAHSGRW